MNQIKKGFDMIKYIKYYFSIFLAFLFMAIILKGSYFPTIFLILFSIILITGDSVIKRDQKLQTFSHPFFLDLSIYNFYQYYLF